MTSTASVVFIGHVDAGKSTTCGQILIKSGQVDSRLLSKYADLAAKNNRDTWWIAYLMDSSDEERYRGKTVELGSASFTLTSKGNSILDLSKNTSNSSKNEENPSNLTFKDFVIWDAPGHKNYITNMVSGVFLSDFAVLIISARTGEFEAGFERGGQTREHAFLAKASGLSHLVVAVNKMDTVNWSIERFEHIKNRIESFLKSYGFKGKDSLSFVPISSQDGENVFERSKREFVKESLMERFSKLHSSYSSTKKEKIEELEVEEEKRVLVTVLDNEKDSSGLKDVGIKVLKGKIRVNDILYLPENKTSLQIESISPFSPTSSNTSSNTSENNIEIKEIEKEGRVTFKVYKSEDNNFSALKQKLRELDTLSAGKKSLEENKWAEIVEVKIKVVMIGSEEPLMTKGFVYNLYCMTGMTEVEILKFRKDGKKKNVAGKGDVVMAHVKITGKNVMLGEGRMGRIIIREGNNTVAFGVFEKVLKFKN